MRQLRRLLTASIAIAVLSSCGGGNGGPAPLDITASSPPAGTTGASYAGYMFTASGGTPPLSWKESGPLPPGLTLSASGQLSGMPATAGTYPFSVTVTDSSNPSLTVTSAQISVRINDSAIVIAPAHALVAGETKEGRLEHAGDKRQYPLNLAANDVAYVRLEVSSPCRDGHFHWDISGRIEVCTDLVRVQAEGQTDYMVTVGPSSLAAEGYKISRISPRHFDLNLGEARTGEIETPGGEDEYSIEVKRGDVAYLQADPKANARLGWGWADNFPNMQYGIDFSIGRVVFGDAGKRSLRVGAYGLSASLDATGPYWIGVIKPRKLTLKQGEAAEGNIDTPGGQDEYTITVEKGEIGYFQSNTERQELVWGFVESSGLPIPIYWNIGRIQFKDAGTYTLRVGAHGNETGHYRIAWLKDDPTKQ